MALAQALDALGRAQDRAADRLAGKGAILHQVVGQLVGAILAGGDFLQDHLAFALQLVARELAVLENVGEDIEGDADVVAQHAGEVGGGLQRRRRVQVAADVLDFLGNALRRPALRALEGHMLEEMRNAVLDLALMAGATGDPHAERRRLQMRHLVRDDPQSIT